MATVIRCFLACVIGVLPVAASEIDEQFKNPGKDWKLVRSAQSIESLAWPKENEQPGLRFISQGLDTLSTPIDLAGACEVVAEIQLISGQSATWRNNGIIISFSSGPVQQMAKTDWAILFAAVQQGMTATVTRGGTRWGHEIRPGVWNYSGAGAAPRYVLSMAGGGGHDYSAKWPVSNLANTRLRFHAMRTSDHIVQLTVYHADGDAAPWWRGEAKLPADLQSAPLKWITIHTGREAGAFATPAAEVPVTARLSGIVHRVAARAMDDGKSKWNQPFPSATLAAKPRPTNHKPMLIPAGDIAALRAKFNNPAFAHYKAVLLRNASEKRAPKAYNSPAQGEYLSALLWAYVLTQDQSYFDRCLAEIDTLITATDKTAAESNSSPGHLMQILDISEFMGHNIADLATAYDLLGQELDPRRRDRICFVLNRAVNNFVDRIKSNDWWYANNPSNTIGVGSGTMGIVALALRHDNPELSRQAIDAAVKTITAKFSAVRPDGACIEGNMYWNYGLSYPIMLGFALKNIEGNDRGLLTSPQLNNAYRYVQNILGGDGTMIPFNDTQPWLNGWLICAHAGSEFDQPLMRWMADKMAAEFATSEKTFSEQDRARFAISAFLYRDTTAAPRDFPGVPTLSTLESVQEGVLRSDHSFIPAMVLGVKGKGAFSTHHANMDQGSFVLYARGQFFLIDPGYFDGNAADHTLPLIGPIESAKLDPRAPCPISDAWEANNLRAMTVDATAAYGKAAKRVRRVLVMVADTTAIALDDIEPATPDAKVTAQFQAGFATAANGTSFTITAPAASLTVTTFGPDLKFDSTPRKFKRDTWAFASRPNVAWHSLRAAYTPDPVRPLITIMTPAMQDKPAPIPSVHFTDNQIDIQIDTQSVTFTRNNRQWQAVKP